jgi:hypothetical protein
MVFVDRQKAIAVDMEHGAEVAVTKHADAAQAVRASLVVKLPISSVVLWISLIAIL